MKKRILVFLLALSSLCSPGAVPVRLPNPNLNRGDSVMKAFSQRRSVKSFSKRKPSVGDISDLLYAANGVNRPDDGRRTAPSAMNRRDIKIYVCTEDGAYLYDAVRHALDPVSDTDLRQSAAPLCLVLVSDFNDKWSGLDAGIVSQNISIFCAGTGLATYPHTTMDRAALAVGLKLRGTQTPMICNSVGFAP